MFTRDWTVRFGDADVFGIAYYPRIVEEFHDTADMFMDEMGLPLWALPQEHDIGLPIVDVGAEFESQLNCGDTVTIELQTETSTSSTRFTYTGRIDDTVAFRGYEQRVCAPVDGEESIPIPDELRAVLETAAVEE